MIWTCAWLLPLSLPSAYADAPLLQRAWELTSQMRLREAEAVFQPHAAAGNREATLGAALTDLEQPPFSAGKLARVRAQLATVAEADRDDETGIRARYLLGRIRQLYDPSLATSGAPELIALVQEHPAHFLAQLAVIKLALHRLYALAPDESPARRLASAEQALSRITHPELKRDFHLVLGDAYLFFGDQRASALPHYRAAEELGIPDANVRATVLVQIGELARLEDNSAVAIIAYRKFLASFRRDLRGFEIRKRLATLEGTP